MELKINELIIDGGNISTTFGNITLTPKAGSAVVIDGASSFDGSVVSGLLTLSNAVALNVTQSSTSSGLPVLVLTQSDVDDTFVNYVGSTAADGTKSISSDTSEDGAKFGAFRVEINGVTKWVRVYDDHS